MPEEKPRPYLPESVNFPSTQDELAVFWDELYRRIAVTISSKDFGSHPISVFDYPVAISYVKPFGSYILIVSGVNDNMPAIIVSVLKPSSAQSGVINVLQSIPGTGGVWDGRELFVESTISSVTIRHTASGTTGAFNIRLLGE